VTHIEPSGPWTSAEARSFLCATAIPLRLSAVSPSGFPIVVSLWFVSDENVIWCATSKAAKVVRFLMANEKCGFEVAADQPPYRGLRGQARARICPDRGQEILVRLIDRYLENRECRLARWLMARAESEVAICLDPIRIQSWDYTSRMTTVATRRQS
jgi:nitroimidazol reductase NimA-like FMN-containing flavoprotein (pyridoxamine 5'-phosphate oxidase superfamily)